MLTVHHLGISQSDRIVWLCEELGLDYALERYDRDPQTRLAPADYKALHPAGTAPVITDGDVVLAESGAIIDYLIAKYGDGRLALGPDHPDFADYLYWFHFANGSMMPASMVAMLSAAGAVSGAAGAIFLKRGELAWQMVEKRLGEARWFAGDEFTAADIMMVFLLTTMRRFAPRDISAFANIAVYIERVGQRPAYKRAMAKAEPGA